MIEDKEAMSQKPNNAEHFIEKLHWFLSGFQYALVNNWLKQQCHSCQYSFFPV